MISILPHIVRLLAAKVEFIYIDIIPPILNRPPSFSPIRLDIKAICFLVGKLRIIGKTRLLNVIQFSFSIVNHITNIFIPRDFKLLVLASQETGEHVKIFQQIIQVTRRKQSL